MNYLVTGGTGFVGAYVTKQLAEKGDHVTALDVKVDEERLNRLIDTGSRENVRTAVCDITDLNALVKICEENRIEKIIHTAAVLDSKNPPLTTAVNCVGTVNILEAGLRVAAKRIVIASSVSAFGSPDRYEQEYIPNNAPQYPSTVDGASKSFIEGAVQDYYKRGVDAIVCRFTHVYGPGRLNGMGAAIDNNLVTYPALGQPGDVPLGEDTHNWLYVKDAAKALITAACVEKTVNRCFTTGGDVASVVEAADIVRTIIPDAQITLQPGKFYLANKFDYTETREDLGFVNDYTIQTGIADFIDEVRKEHDLT